MSSEYFIRNIKSVSQNDLELNIYQCFPFLIMWPHAFSLLASHKHLLFALSFFISPSLTSFLIRVWIHSLVLNIFACSVQSPWKTDPNWSMACLSPFLEVIAQTLHLNLLPSSFAACSLWPIEFHNSTQLLLSPHKHPHSDHCVLKVMLKWDRNLNI